MAKEIKEKTRKNKTKEDKVKAKKDIAVEAKKVLDNDLSGLYDTAPVEVLLIQLVRDQKEIGGL